MKKKETGKKNRKKKRQHFLIEEDNDSDREEPNPYDHFDDEPDLTEESRKACPVHKRPHEKRNCVNPYCVKKNINHTHNTKDCKHTDKKASDLQPHQIRPPVSPCVPYQKDGANTGSYSGNRHNTGPKISSSKSRSTFYSEKGRKGKGKGKGKQSHGKGNRQRLVCTFCKKDGHEKSKCRAFARA